MTTISVHDLHRKIISGDPICLLDVRTPVEYAGAHISLACLQPLESFDPINAARQCSRSKGEVYVICQSGMRARQAINKLEDAGLSECTLVEGGMSAWIEAGLEVERQPVRVISLERQVRIAAGTLVVTGTVLGIWLYPAYLAISGFVGAGLIFAGVCDKCGMAMLLARMPWNQKSGGQPQRGCGATK